MKIATIVGTRPEIIRLSCIIPALDKAFEHVLIHTGQSYDRELSALFFEELELRRPDYNLFCGGQENGVETPCDAVGLLIVRAERALKEIKPDAVLILGDTNSALAAYAAKRLKIPVFHMEAGNRCYDERVPEEINRRIVDHISDINLPYSQIGRENLLREGLPPDRIIVTGSPMNEVIHHYSLKIGFSDVRTRLNLAKYYLVSAHREENIGDSKRLNGLITILQRLGERHPVVVSTHPRTRKALRGIALDNVQFLNPLGFFDYMVLQTNAVCTLSDSGSLFEESAILNFKALSLRDTFERQEAMEDGAVMLVGLDWQRTKEALEILEGRHELVYVRDYSVPIVSEKIVRIIQSYTSYVKRVVWHESDN